MWRENLEVLRRAYAAYNQGDLDGLLGQLRPRVIWEENHPLFGFVGLDPVYEGHEGVRRWWKETRQLWTTVEAVIDEITPVGDDALVVGNTMRGSGAGSGAAVEQPFSRSRVPRREDHQTAALPRASGSAPNCRPVALNAAPSK